jgi:hypothetical protein
MLCAFDRYGNYTGATGNIDIGEDGLTLEATMGDDAPCQVGGREITLAGQKYRHEGFTEHVGNIHWGCAAIRLSEAVRLVNHLRRLGWSLTEAPSEVHEAFGLRDLTEADLMEVAR